MTHFRWSDMGAALAGCVALFAVSCRNDAHGTDSHGTDLGAARSAPAAVASNAQTTVPNRGATAASPSTAPIPHSAQAAASVLEKNDACAGPSTGPLPQLEEHKLAAERKGQYRFELKYPLFHEDDEKVTQKLNRQLLERLKAIEKRFVSEAEGQETGSDPDNARWFEGKCATAYHSKSFVSVACDTMEGPGAHPNLDKFAVNFRICPDVHELTLTDVCRSLPDCRKGIIALINEDFRAGEKKQTGIQFRDGPRGQGEASDPEHPVAELRVFGITPTGLRFFLFDELPHVLQAFAVVDVPATKLRPVLRDDVARRIWGP